MARQSPYVRMALHVPMAFRIPIGGAMTLVALAGATLVSGCNPPPPEPQAVVEQPAAPPVEVQPAPPPAPPPVAATPTPTEALSAGRAKIALLAPLTGPNKPVGQAMLDAANMAMFDVSADMALLPRDTGSTPDDARAAAGRAVSDGAGLILGPVFAASVPPVREATQAMAPQPALSPEATPPDATPPGATPPGATTATPPVTPPAAPVTVIAYTTDATVAGGNVFVMGFLPAGQIDRVVGFAKSRGMTKLAALVPDNAYGAAVTAEINAIGPKLGLQPSRILVLGRDPKAQLAGLADDPPEMLLLALGGDQLVGLAPAISDYAAAHPVQLLGTGLWADDPALSTVPALAGGWYASPLPNNFADFAARFQRIYSYRPPRIAALAYDSIALAWSIARNAASTASPVSRDALLQPNGFIGIDGGFRFLPSGLSERNLAVLAVNPNGPIVIDPPPPNFEKLGE